jgi:hypothetical protein
MRPTTIAVLLCVLAAAAAAADRSAGNASPAAALNLENLARGRPYTVTPRPDYRHCTDPGDAAQLTDGAYTRGYFWTQKSTVGWRLGPPKFVRIDLGAERPVRGVSWSTAAGVAGVQWPQAILIFVSRDGQEWFEAGDLVRLSARRAEPPAQGYATHVYWTDALATRGRYVQLAAVPSGPYLFCDEIEVFRGPDALLQAAAPGRPVADPHAAMASRQVTALAQAQFRRDLAAVRAGLEAADPAGPQKAALAARADALSARIEAMPPLEAAGFRAVLPMTDLEHDIFRLHAAVRRARGEPPLRLWKTHRWDPLAPSQGPEAGSARGSAAKAETAVAAAVPALAVHAMQGERRADVLNLTSAGDEDLAVRLRLTGLPGGATPPYLSVHEVEHAGTRHFVSVAAALPPAARDGDGWLVTVPAGMTRQVWFSFRPEDLAAGTYEGAVTVRAPGADAGPVPVRLRVYPLRMPEAKTLRLGGWSYTNGRGSYGVTSENRSAFISYLRSRHVNAPWATSAAMPAGTYDAAGAMVEEPDTANFDAWVRQWPGAACYMVFASVGSYASVQPSFAGSEAGTPLFEKKVAAWIRFWAGHMRRLGLGPDRLGLLLVDEPNRPEQYEAIAAWARVIQKAEPEVLVWEDPCPASWDGFDAMAASVDVLTPNRSHWLERGEAFRERFRALRRGGRPLGFYSCAGPARCFDPYSYYLLQQWQCFEEGATWSGFWAFGDNARQSCWNEYLAEGNGPYCPLYLDETSVTPAKYMEAIAEGVQDYETLVMLRDRVAAAGKAGAPDAARARGRALLAGACGRVLAGAGVEGYRWDAPKDRSAADAVRVEILEVLAALGEYPGR